MANDVVDEERLRMSRKSTPRLKESDKRLTEICMGSF